MFLYYCSFTVLIGIIINKYQYEHFRVCCTYCLEVSPPAGSLTVKRQPNKKKFYSSGVGHQTTDVDVVDLLKLFPESLAFIGSIAQSVSSTQHKKNYLFCVIVCNKQCLCCLQLYRQINYSH